VDPAAPGPKLQIITEQALYQFQVVGAGGVVQPMGAVVDPLSRELETPGHAAHMIRRLEDGALVSCLCGIEGGHQPAWSRSENRDLSHRRGRPG
jgi:hypothetical protein